MKVLVTGAAGFIGSATAKALLNKGHDVVGIDNINTYYDTSLKLARLRELGIAQADIVDGAMCKSGKFAGMRFAKMDISDRGMMSKLFADEGFDAVINLAGQAGVRYSIENPYSYIESNIVGFMNILEGCRHNPVRHLVYASSSSVYGMAQSGVPYSENDRTDSPVSLYAATKKSDEVMAYSYSKLYKIPATGVRPFTVYGPWGRPDMAPFIFMKAILNGEPIKVFNHGRMQRDFTYVDDVVRGIIMVMGLPSEEEVPHRIYNIGHSSPVQLLDFIGTIERVSGRKATMEMKGMQPGDVVCTYADTTRIEHDFGYRPSVGIEEGITRFYDWYTSYYGVEGKRGLL